MKHKCLCVFSIVLGLILLASACANRKKTENTVYVEYAFHNGVDEMFEAADCVIRGRIADSTVEWLSWLKQEIATVYTVEIAGFYKGDTGKKAIEVMTMGAETATAVFRYEPEITVSMNTEYIMFLGKSREHNNTFWLIAGPYSLYRIEGDRIIGVTNALSYDDLSRLAKAQEDTKID